MRKISPAVTLSFVVLLCLSGPSLTQRVLGVPAPEPSKAPEALRDKPRTRTAGRPPRWWSLASATIRSCGRIWRNAWSGRFGPATRSMPPRANPSRPRAVLREMLAEKAMSLEGRALGYLKDESIRPGLEQFEQQLLARMLLDREFRDRVTAEPAQVDQAMKANPKWTREQATAMVQQAVANRLFESYYKGLVEKFHLKKEAGNFAQAAQHP